MNNELQKQVGSQKPLTPATVATPAVDRADMPSASAAPVSQTSGDGTEALVEKCSAQIDDGLAPLVAAGIVKPGLATVITSSLRVGIGEACGAPIGNRVLFLRTLKAVHMTGKNSVEADAQIGGA